MADTRRKTVLLSGDRCYFKEAKSTAAAITPGDLVEIVSGGYVQRHALAGGNASKKFAFENEGVGGTIDTGYANSSLVKFFVAERGSVVNVRLATSQTIVAGDKMESAGAGLVRKHLPDYESGTGEIMPECIVGIAMEAVTTTSSVARLAMEVI